MSECVANGVITVLPSIQRNEEYEDVQCTDSVLIIGSCDEGEVQYLEI